MAVKGINHYTVIGHDLEAAKQFYCHIVGLKLLKKRNQGVTTNIDFSLPDSNEAIVSVIDANVDLAENTRDVGFQLHGQASLDKGEKFSTGAFEHVCFSFDDADFATIKEKLIEND